jgi:hypothetical protein
MSTTQWHATPLLDLVGSVSAALVTGGILTMALFPFAVPLIALIAAVVIALGLVALALGVVVAVLAAPIVLVMRLRRRG